MGVCINLICPKKKENSSLSGNNMNTNELKRSLSITQNNFSSHLKYKGKNYPNLNSSLNKINDNFNSSSLPFSKNKISQISNTSNKSLKMHNLSTTTKMKYSISNHQNEKIIHSNLKDKIICFFCCRKKCEFENYLTNKNKPNGIKGLNSNYITEKIIIGQRPSDNLINKFHLIEQFKKLNIGLIINLQKQGEHPFCGLNSSKLNNLGYSYNLFYFSGNNIIVKFFGWQEIKNQLAINYILFIVKEICLFILNQKQNIYIHCHSGNNRSAIICACYLIYTTNENVNDVIRYIKEKRNSCLASKNDKKQIYFFNNFIQVSRIIFGKKEKIEVYLKRQDDLLFGYEAEKFIYVPRIITKTLERILEIKFKYNLDNLFIMKIIKGLEYDWNNELETLLYLIKQNLNKNDWNIFYVNENLSLFVELLFDFFEDSTYYIINPEKTDILINFEPFQKYIKQNNYLLTEQQKINILSFIRKVLFGYEYSIIFQISSFCALFSEKKPNENYNILFHEMLDRFSIELLGYNLSFIQNLKNQTKTQKDLIENRITSLSLIINLIINEILNPKNYHNENNKPNIFLFPSKSNYNFYTLYDKKKENSDRTSDLKTMSLLNNKNLIINNQNESSNDLLLNNNINEEEKKIKNAFPKKTSNKFLRLDNKQMENINNTFTFNNSPKSIKENINFPLSKSQSSLLTFKNDIFKNSFESHQNSNKLKAPSNQLYSQNSSLLNDIQNFNGRKSCGYNGLILK